MRYIIRRKKADGMKMRVQKGNIGANATSARCLWRSVTQDPGNVQTVGREELIAFDLTRAYHCFVFPPKTLGQLDSGGDCGTMLILMNVVLVLHVLVQRTFLSHAL